MVFTPLHPEEGFDGSCFCVSVMAAFLPPPQRMRCYWVQLIPGDMANGLFQILICLQTVSGCFN